MLSYVSLVDQNDVQIVKNLVNVKEAPQSAVHRVEEGSIASCTSTDSEYNPNNDYYVSPIRNSNRHSGSLVVFSSSALTVRS